jgi:hypothetical protein
MTEPNPWADIVGLSYTTASFLDVIGGTEADLDRAADELRVLRLTTVEGVILYPAFQVHDGSLVPGLDQVLPVLRTGVDDPWTWAQWLNTDLPGRGRNIDRLIDGGLDAVVRRAEQAAGSWVS